MPVMNGLEATQQIRSQDENKTVPIIGLSANARQEHIEDAISSGMNDYIIKPYNKEVQHPPNSIDAFKICIDIIIGYGKDVDYNSKKLYTIKQCPSDALFFRV